VAAFLSYFIKGLCELYKNRVAHSVPVLARLCAFWNRNFNFPWIR